MQGTARNGVATRIRLIAFVLATALALGMTLGLAGCSIGGKSIEGNWRLVSGHDSAGSFDLTGLRVTLAIDGAKSGGQGPCNFYGSPFDSSTTGHIVIGQSVSTSMGCIPASRMTLDSRYFAVLMGTGSTNNVIASFKGAELVLTGGNGTLTYARSHK
jgi:heat shock protein HslJ